MKVVILAGGLGTRFAEETDLRPKPMIEIGGNPLLLHIMKTYAKYGFRDFVIAGGYKHWVIKEYFRDFTLHNRDLEVQMSDGSHRLIGKAPEYDWRVTIIDTGVETPTAGRLLRIKDVLAGSRFFLTYGDGVADVDIAKLLDFHLKQGRLATVTAVHPPARFGSLELEGDQVSRFAEKPQTEQGWINGGFFVFEPESLSYMRDDVMLEREPLERLAADTQLAAFRHEGFWQPMDTLRDKRLLESLWSSGKAPWAS
jgi:glucose-1-phosphate cytidylyltransferase